MATLFTSSCTCSTPSQKNHLSSYSFSKSLTFPSKAHIKRFKFAVKYEKTEDSDSSTSSSSSVVISKTEEKEDTQKKDLLVDRESEVEVEEQQEMDWKTDEEFKKFMGNPSIEAAIKLEKKRADRKLKELDRENSDNPVVGLLKKVAIDSLSRQKQRLEKAEEAFKALDLNKVILI